jgi:TP53 regulating kinase-like protein
MKQNIFYKKGAEAELVEEVIDGKKVLIKNRIPKNYKNPTLDLKIRRTRTKSEAKLLKESSAFVNVPKIIEVNDEESKITMEFIQGKRLKEVIEKKTSLCIEAGKSIKALHEGGIIHGDLTTSNIIFASKGTDKELNLRIKKHGPLFFIDFGLGYFSKNIESKATDLIVFKKTFNATHSKIKNGWDLVMKGYSPSIELVERMNAVEKRARYH